MACAMIQQTTWHFFFIFCVCYISWRNKRKRAERKEAIQIQFTESSENWIRIWLQWNGIWLQLNNEFRWAIFDQMANKMLLAVTHQILMELLKNLTVSNASNIWTSFAIYSSLSLNGEMLTRRFNYSKLFNYPNLVIEELL